MMALLRRRHRAEDQVESKPNQQSINTRS